MYNSGTKKLVTTTQENENAFTLKPIKVLAITQLNSLVYGLNIWNYRHNKQMFGFEKNKNKSNSF